ncbi:MAG: hypothetical protein ACH37Z_06415 [Anaerolineae bacterium]|nr:hypothetical protein [Ardenticatenia bacterium]
MPYAFSSGRNIANAPMVLASLRMHLFADQPSNQWMSAVIVLGDPISTLVAGGVAYWLLKRMLAVRDPGQREWTLIARGMGWLVLSGLLLKGLSALGQLLLWLQLLGRSGKSAWVLSAGVPVFGLCLSMVWALSRGRSSAERLAVVLLPSVAPAWSGWVIRAALAGAVGSGVELIANLAGPLTLARYWSSSAQSTPPGISPMASLVYSRSVRDLGMVLVAMLVFGPALRRTAGRWFSEWPWSTEQRLMARFAVLGLLTGIGVFRPIILQLTSSFRRIFPLSWFDLGRLSNVDMLLIGVAGVATFLGVIALSRYSQRRRSRSEDDPASSAPPGLDANPAVDIQEIARIDARANDGVQEDSGATEAPSA